MSASSYDSDRRDAPSGEAADRSRRIADALARIDAVVRRRELEEAQDEGLSPLQARALGALDRRPGLRVGELARELLVTVGTISAAVRVLEEKGLVAKRSDPDEHRAVVLRLTAKGRGLRKRRGAWAAEMWAPVVEDLGDDASGALLDGLLRALRAMEHRGWIDPASMCFRCEYFRPWGGRGAKPHRCELLRAAIGRGELQVDCPDFEPAAPSVQDERWAALRDAGG